MLATIFYRRLIVVALVLITLLGAACVPQPVTPPIDSADEMEAETTIEVEEVEEVEEEEAPGSDNPVGADWVLNELDGTNALGGWPVTAIFGEDGTLSGSAGCNSYTADYTFDGDAVSIGMPAATMMMCESETAMAQESAYLAALPQVMTYAVEGVELVLSGPDGVPEIRYTTTMAVQQSAWLVDLLADAAGDLKPLLAGSEITASFDGNAIIGFDGCGNYTAKYATQGANIEIQTAVVSAAGVPPADCEPGGELAAQSDAYQGALTGAALFDISGVHLNMYDESGNQLLTFTAAEAQ